MIQVVVLLLAFIGGMAGYWYIMFRKVLPLQRRAERASETAAQAASFASEVLQAGLAGRTRAQAALELSQRVVQALHRRFPELALCWAVREDDGSSRALASLGRPWEQALDALSRWEDGVEADVSGVGGRLADALTAEGYKRVRVLAWGGTPPRGWLAAADRDAGGASLAAAGPLLELASRLGAIGEAFAADLERLSTDQEKLQGGLERALEELNKTHSRLILKSKQVKTLQDVALTLASKPGQTESTLSAVVSIVARSLGADLVAFLLLDDSSSELVTQPGAYGLEGEELLYRIRLDRDESSSVRVFKSGEPFVTGDAQTDPRVIGHYAKMWRVHSIMVVPLKLEDHCIGVMRVGSREKDFFNPEQLEFVTAIAEEAAVLVETAMLNRRLSEVAEQLAALSRIKDDFVSTVSHEFKTPLTTITGFLTVVLDGEAGPLTPDQARFLGVAKNAARRLGSLVSDLLDLSKLEGGARMELQRLDLAAILEASAETHSHPAQEAGKKLVVDIGPLPAVQGDERWLGVVVDNLLSNGLKFTKAGGEVRLKALDKGDMVLVTVADDGIGIPPEEREKVFEKFFRASNRGEVNASGTGLGLTIAREVLAKHGGKIWVESEPGKGSRFHFVLPKAPEETPA